MLPTDNQDVDELLNFSKERWQVLRNLPRVLPAVPLRVVVDQACAAVLDLERTVLETST
jgi:hypothetical protein